MATELLSRKDARRLAILGTGEQARAHARAIPLVRAISEIRVWGRNPHHVEASVKVLASEGLPVRGFNDVASCTAGADVICTTTSSNDPILFGGHVESGTHLNLVGSSYLGPREVDDALVVRSKFFGDSLLGVLEQASEFHHTRQKGLIDQRHLLAVIGEVISGTHSERASWSDVTIYKSLGHVAQDLASARFVFEAARSQCANQISF